MKISPVAPIGSSNQVPQHPAIPMRVNANPVQYDPAGQSPNAVPAPSSTSDTTGQANASEVTQPLSPQYAAIARQRRALQVRERALADRERAVAGQGNGSPGIDIAQLKAEPLRVLLDNGVTYEQLTEAVLANKNGYNPEVQQLKQELKSIKDGFDKTLSDRDSQQEQQVLREMRNEVSSLARQGDEYEMIRVTNSVPQVMKLIERTYREHGEVLDVVEAMQLIEGELVKDYTKAAETKKVQTYFQKSAPQPQYQRPMRTLTNRDNATPQVDRKQRALAAFYGTQVK